MMAMTIGIRANKVFELDADSDSVHEADNR